MDRSSQSSNRRIRPVSGDDNYKALASLGNGPAPSSGRAVASILRVLRAIPRTDAAMVRRDVDALVKWAAGSGAATVLPHAVTLPAVLATSLAWVGGLGIFITAAIAVVVGLTKLTVLTVEATRFIDALDTLRARIRQFRRRSRASQTRKGGAP